ncbi:RICIN domain-containing protein [Actinospica robiniae]|uniref:RICIN domain-containing protein n=1 Tax=Actinospica robiniae TaxID=304901 RepID=UPI00041C69EC|nr:RICIN domain-containing protein [Actinospica robiniae]
MRTRLWRPRTAALGLAAAALALSPLTPAYAAPTAASTTTHNSAALNATNPTAHGGAALNASTTTDDAASVTEANAAGQAGAAAPAATTTTPVTVNGTSAGRTFDGIGAISGGGGNSRLLIDYPPSERPAILNYLFKPGYGADLQILKVEIGGDTNSTDGSESSIEHTSGTVNCGTGYEWWLMEQAKALNPAIKLYGLAWGAPGWIGGGNFWSTDTINYLVAWLGCAQSHGLSINYLGGWNERGYNISWYEQLRSTLNADGYANVTIVGADSDWSIAGDIDDNSAFATAVGIIGTHYPCGGDGGSADTCSTTSAALSSGKPLWASENGSQDTNSGAPAMIRSIVRGYTDASMTAYINWPLVAAIYPNLGYDTTGLMVANSPWSGAYEVGAETWATAQVTQFTAPGWQFLNTGSGYLGGSESNGAYVSLKSTNGSDYTTILETTTATAAQTATFTVGGGLSTGTVHVWTTNLGSNNPSAYFVHSQDITPSNGTYSLTLQPGYIYTVSTTTGQGKGTAASPATADLPLPYTDTFSSDATGSEAKYLSDQNGSFEIRPCTGGRSGQCVEQMAAQAPISWDNPSNPYTTLGDLSWTNYTVSAYALMNQAGAVQLLGRVGSQHPFSVAGIDEYYLQLSNTGAWQIVKNDYNGTLTTLASGTVTAPGTGSWSQLALSFSGTKITAAINGTTVGSATDASYSHGQVGLGVNGWQTDEFANLSITPIGTNPVAATYQLLNESSGLALATASGSTAQGAGIVQATLLQPTASGATDQQWQLLGQGNGTDVLTNVASGMVLDVPASSTTSGVQLDQWSANGGANQQWQVAQNADGSYTLTSASSSLAAEVAGSSSATGAAVDQASSTAAANQKWLLVSVPEPNATYTLVNHNSGLVADITGGSTSNGGLLIQWVPNGGLNQRWTLTPLSGGYDTVTNVNSGLVLDVPNSSTTQGAQLEQWSANGGTNQQWTLTELADGYYTLTARNSGMAADVNGASLAENATVIQWPSNGGTNQQWQLNLAY